MRRESKEKLTQKKKKKSTPFLIKKPEKGQETIGEVVSIGEKFVTVKSEKQTIRRIPQNLKKVGRLKKIYIKKKRSTPSSDSNLRSLYQNTVTFKKNEFDGIQIDHREGPQATEGTRGRWDRTGSGGLHDGTD